MSFFETLVAALLLGLASIPHCIAMCGPLAVLSCGKAGRQDQRFGYLAARVISYATVGSMLGWLGARSFANIGNSAGRWGLVAMAGVCLWRAVGVYRKKKAQLVQLGSAGHGSVGQVGGALRKLAALLPTRGAGLGMATAIFPCGALVAAWSVAAGSAHPVSGAVGMAAFAIASTPALLFAMGGQHLIARIGAAVPRPLLAGGWLIGASVLLSRAYTQTCCHG